MKVCLQIFYLLHTDLSLLGLITVFWIVVQRRHQRLNHFAHLISSSNSIVGGIIKKVIATKIALRHLNDHWIGLVVV